MGKEGNAFQKSYLFSTFLSDMRRAMNYYDVVGFRGTYDKMTHKQWGLCIAALCEAG